MPYNVDERGFEATVLHGVAAVIDALSNIGDIEERDEEIAKTVVKNEMQLRALVTFALRELARTV